jgi:hypothetical protein
MGFEVVTNAQAICDNGKVVILSFLFWGFEGTRNRMTSCQGFGVEKVVVFQRTD